MRVVSADKRTPAGAGPTGVKLPQRNANGEPHVGPAEDTRAAVGVTEA